MKQKEKENNNSRLSVSRRETLIAALSGGLISALGSGTASANPGRSLRRQGRSLGEGRVGIDLDDNTSGQGGSGDGGIYRQARIDETGNMEEMSVDLDENFELTLEGSNGEIDGTVTVDIDARFNHNVDEDEYGKENTDNDGLLETGWGNLVSVTDSVQGETITFSLDESTSDFDLSDSNIEDGNIPFSNHESISDDYEELGVSLPDNRSDVEGVPRNKTLVEVRIRMYDTEGEIDEEITVEFTLDVTPELGLGKLLGYNFGVNHIDDWPSDWAEG